MASALTDGALPSQAKPSQAYPAHALPQCEDLERLLARHLLRERTRDRAAQVDLLR